MVQLVSVDLGQKLQPEVSVAYYGLLKALLVRRG